MSGQTSKYSPPLRALALFTLSLGVLADDAGCRALLLGKWIQQHKDSTQQLEWTTTYLLSGQYQHDIDRIASGKKSSLVVRGAWHVRDGKISYVPERQSAGAGFQGGKATVDAIVYIRNQEFRYTDSRGDGHSKTRVTPKSSDDVGRGECERLPSSSQP